MTRGGLHRTVSNCVMLQQAGVCGKHPIYPINERHFFYYSLSDDRYVLSFMPNTELTLLLASANIQCVNTLRPKQSGRPSTDTDKIT